MNAPSRCSISPISSRLSTTAGSWVGAKVSKKYDRATTPHRRAEAHSKVSDEDKAILADTYTAINPAAVQRQIQALTSARNTWTSFSAST
jgi:DNA-binding MurR/RpiR family transcriptional regulator